MTTITPATSFDHLTRSVAHRQWGRATLLRLAAGLALGSLSISAPAALVAACRANGKPCDPRRPAQCCGGRCARRRDGTGRCRRLRSARGCTRRDDFCRESAPPTGTPCPNRPAGLCLTLDEVPACVEGIECFECESDADCQFLAGENRARCIRRCDRCAGTNGRACVVPFA